MLDVADTIENEFISTAENRGDDPEETLSRLMLEYVREDATISELLAEDNSPVQCLKEYDPADDRILGKEAIKSLPSYTEQFRIDPDDITDEEMPQNRNLKRRVILGVLRYQLSGEDTNSDGQDDIAVERKDVKTAAKQVVGDLDTDYKLDEYVRQVLDEVLIPNPADRSKAFFSVSDIQQYLESLEPTDVETEDNVWYLTKYLDEHHSDQIEIDKLNEIRNRFGFDPVDT